MRQRFALGIEDWPEWALDARAQNRIITHNRDGRWHGGPDLALIQTDDVVKTAYFGDFITNYEGKLDVSRWPTKA